MPKTDWCVIESFIGFVMRRTSYPQYGKRSAEEMARWLEMVQVDLFLFWSNDGTEPQTSRVDRWSAICDTLDLYGMRRKFANYYGVFSKQDIYIVHEQWWWCVPWTDLVFSWRMVEDRSVAGEYRQQWLQVYVTEGDRDGWLKSDRESACFLYLEGTIVWCIDTLMFAGRRSCEVAFVW